MSADPNWHGQQMRKQMSAGPPESGAKRKGNHRALILITLACVVLVFGGLEIGVRFWQSDSFAATGSRSIALRDRFAAWRNNPGYVHVDRRINPQGFRREGNVPLEKPPRTVRIFLTGGSVAYGWTSNWPHIEQRVKRLTGNETISHYLEERLNASFPAKRWEVINAAVVGYQLNLELAQTQSVLLKYKPDFIVYLDGHNDFVSLLRSVGAAYDPYASTPTAREFELLANPGSLRSLAFFAAAWLRENSALFRLMMDGMQPAEVFAGPQGSTATVAAPRRLALADLDASERAAVRWAREQLDFYPRLARQVSRVVGVDGVKPVFVLQPELALTGKALTETEQRLFDFQRINPPWYLFAFQELYPELGARMAAAASAEGFAFVSLVDVFDGTSAQVFTDDVHLTPEGNRIVAERLARELGKLAN